MRWTQSCADWSRSDGTTCGVEARPADGRLLGFYLTRRTGSGARPYRTVLHGVDPIDARCNCPDFLKNSLGICKHVLVVLEHLHTRPRVLQQAIKEQEWSDRLARSGLCWDPIRPLTGIGDWLDRVHWKGDFDAAKARSVPRRASRPLVPFESRRQRVLEDQLTLDQPARRLELIEDLLKLVPAGAPESLHDPALRNLLENERRWLKPMRRASALRPGEIRDAIKQLKRPLYPYQREGVDRFLSAGQIAAGRRHGPGKNRAGDRMLPYPAAQRPHPPRADHRAGQSQTSMGSRVGVVLRFAHPCRGRHSRGAAGRVLPAVAQDFSSSITSSSCATWKPSAAGTPNWSSSTRPNGSRTGQPRRPSRSKAWLRNIASCSPARRWKTASTSWPPIVEWVDDMALGTEMAPELVALHPLRWPARGRRSP